MKIFLSIALLMFGAYAVPGQTNDAGATHKPTCALTLAQAPGVSGLKLGMTTDQVLALFPGSREDDEVRSRLARPASQFGISSFSIKPEKYSSRDKFPGISHISFTLLDGRVSTFNVGYSGILWAHVDEFVNRVLEGTMLPAVDAWKATAGMDTQLKTLKCKEFEISVFAGGRNLNHNYVEIRDLVAQKLEESREKAKEKEEMKNSKP